MPGKVFLVGAGPGDPELLTLKARRCLEQADVIVYDSLVDERVLEGLPGRRIFVGKRRGFHSWQQDSINRLLVRLGRTGRTVVRLKGGDPFVFGRGGEEADVLDAAGIPWDVVPGVSSAIAAPASAGIPVTQRGQASMVTIVSGHADPAEGGVDWAPLARLDGTLVVLMGMAYLRQITTSLMLHGKDGNTPAAVIQEATTARERMVTATLATLGDAVESAGIGSPAVIVIGKVATRARHAALQGLALQSQAS